MLFFTHPLCFLLSSFCKQRRQSGRWHLSLGNWFDLTRLNWELDPPPSTTPLGVPAGFLLFSRLSLTRNARTPFGEAGTVRVLVAPLVRNQVSLELIPFSGFWLCLSSLVLYIGLFPSRWLDRSALYFWITLLRTNPGMRVYGHFSLDNLRICWETRPFPSSLILVNNF